MKNLNSVKHQWLMAALASALMGGFSSIAVSGEYDEALKKHLSSDATWIASEAIVKAIKEQNAQHAGLGQEVVDSLDKQWRSESKAGSGPLINKVAASDVSKLLKEMQEQSDGLYVEIFVMDNKGLNVGMSEVTSDYWQGDESKWKKTYLKGGDGLFIDEVEFDDSTDTYSLQVSKSIVDPATNEVIGAITLGVNPDLL